MRLAYSMLILVLTKAKHLCSRKFVPFGGENFHAFFRRGQEMKKIVLVIAGIVFLMAGMANADTVTLNIGGTYNQGIPIDESTGLTVVGGGSITPSSLIVNGVTVNLPYLYCIGLYTDIGVPSTYTTTATQSGYVGIGTTATALTPVNNAAQIAWLLTNYASQANAEAALGNFNYEVALQAAIWHEEYGVSLDSSDTGAYGIYSADILNVGTGDIGNFDWLSPMSGGNYLQDQVTFVPEPSTLLLLGAGMVGLAAFRKRSKKA